MLFRPLFRAKNFFFSDLETLLVYNESKRLGMQETQCICILLYSNQIPIC